MEAFSGSSRADGVSASALCAAASSANACGSGAQDMNYTRTSSKLDFLYSFGPDGMLQTMWPVHGVDDMSEFSAGDREAWLAA